MAEVRSLARGTSPYVLADQGLAAALALATDDAPVSTTVVAAPRRRYAAEIEQAVYFCCLEALQSASKHAGHATAVRLTVAERDDSLCFDVHDNGAGLDSGHLVSIAIFEHESTCRPSRPGGRPGGNGGSSSARTGASRPRSRDAGCGSPALPPRSSAQRW
jgi:hypothetical protein